MADASGRMLLEYHRGEYDGSGRYRSHDGTARDGHPEWLFGESVPEASEAALDRVGQRAATSSVRGAPPGRTR